MDTLLHCEEDERSANFMKDTIPSINTPVLKSISTSRPYIPEGTFKSTPPIQLRYLEQNPTVKAPHASSAKTNIVSAFPEKLRPVEFEMRTRSPIGTISRFADAPNSAYIEPCQGERFHNQPSIIAETDCYWIVYKPRGWNCTCPYYSGAIDLHDHAGQGEKQSIVSFLRSRSSKIYHILESPKFNFGVIIHMDRKWSGITVVAKTKETYFLLVDQLSSGKMLLFIECLLKGEKLKSNSIQTSSKIYKTNLEAIVKEKCSLGALSEEINQNQITHVHLHLNFPPVFLEDLLESNNFSVWDPHSMFDFLSDGFSCHIEGVSFQDINQPGVKEKAKTIIVKCARPKQWESALYFVHRAAGVSCQNHTYFPRFLPDIFTKEKLTPLICLSIPLGIGTFFWIRNRQFYNLDFVKALNLKIVSALIMVPSLVHKTLLPACAGWNIISYLFGWLHPKYPQDILIDHKPVEILFGDEEGKTWLSHS